MKQLKAAAQKLSEAAAALVAAYVAANTEEQENRIDKWYEAVNHLKNDIVLHDFEEELSGESKSSR